VVKSDEAANQVIAGFRGPGLNSGRIQSCGGPIFGPTVFLETVGGGDPPQGYIHLLDEAIRPFGAIRTATHFESGIAPAAFSTPLTYTPTANWFPNIRISFSTTGQTNFTISFEAEGDSAGTIIASVDLGAGNTTGIDVPTSIMRALTITARNDELISNVDVLIDITANS